MKKVNLYIRTSLRGPGTREGRYAAVTEYLSAKGPVTRETAGTEQETTYHQSVLAAIVEGLKILNMACHVTVYTDCVYVKNTIERGSLGIWRMSGWKKADGTAVRHAERWQQAADLMDLHEMEFRFSKHCAYEEKLRALLGRENKESDRERENH